MKRIALFLVGAVAVLAMSSCNSYRQSMREPNAHVEFYASDFELSEPFTGEATVTHVLYIDWEHLFGTTRSGVVGDMVPVVGHMLEGGANYALYDLMQKHPGYDVVFYPQVSIERHAPVLGTGIYSTTTYKVTARLGKMKQK